jgi:hypothetical protein
MISVQHDIYIWLYNTHTSQTHTYTCTECMGKQGNVALHLPYEVQDNLCSNHCHLILFPIHVFV